MISVRDMRIAEDNASVHGITKSMLMERAGAAFAKELKKTSLKSVCMLCYHGNNGGDGFVIARLLSSSARVTVVFLGDESRFSPETEENFRALPNKVEIVRELKAIKRRKFHVIVDALLGTGGKGKLKEPLSSAVTFFNSSQARKYSVDVPTGTDPDSGMKTDPYANPDITITFHDKKPGLSGKIITVDIGIPKKMDIGPGELIAAVPERPPQSKKGDYGKILVIGGSEDFAGAPALAIMALSALRGGADLVRVAAPSKVAWAINSFSPDVITKKLKGTHLAPQHLDLLREEIEWADVILLGPGLGKHPETEQAVNSIITTPKPKVIDADAIRFVTMSKLKNAILTPHKGEFTSLWQNEFGMVRPKRLDSTSLKQLQAIMGDNIVLLKGATDTIISSDAIKENSTGDAGMTVGGTGDVLAGLTAGLLSICKDPFLSACAAAWLSGKTGEACKREMHNSYIASDVVRKIPEIISSTLRNV